MKRIVAVFFLVVLVMGSGLSVSAGGIPVFDAVADALRALQHSLQGKEYAEAVKQFKELQKTVDSLSGETDIGDFLNDSSAQDLRRSMPDELQPLLDSLDGGSDVFDAVIASYIESYGKLEGDELFEDESLQAQFDNHLNTTIIADTAATDSFDKLEGHVSDIEDLLDKINDSDTTKKQLDVVARLLAQNALLQVESIRMSALALKAQAAAMQREHTVSQQTRSNTGYQAEYSTIGSD